MSDQSDTFGVDSVLIHVALHGFPGMTVKDDDPLYQMLRTGLRESEILPSSHPWLIKCRFALKAELSLYCELLYMQTAFFLKGHFSSYGLAIVEPLLSQ